MVMPIIITDELRTIIFKEELATIIFKDEPHSPGTRFRWVGFCGTLV
jgi:hypothetical protein